MAAVYIQPGTGTGSGTLEDPYFYSELSTAEISAGSGGTILFTDGVYEFTGDAELKADGVVYKSQNHLGATLKRNVPGGANTVIVSDPANAAGSIIEGFYIQDLHIAFFPANDPAATNIPKAINIKQHDTASSLATSVITKSGDESNNYRFSVEGSEFKYIAPALDYIRPFSRCSSGDMKNCTVYMDLSAATGISNRLSAHWRSLENTILSSNNSLNNPINYAQSATNCAFYNMGSINETGGINNISTNPLFIDADNGDLRLRPNSPLIGGVQSESTNNNYYLQPGNPYNGDGSQKDASAMAADGDPGPFNDFKEIVAADVPYGSTIVILNGTYNWTDALGKSSSNVNSTNWEDYTLAGYNYVAETSGQVIFDGQNHYNSVFVYKPFGGTPGAGVYMDLDTTFTGIQFNNIASSSYDFRCQITSHSGAAGQGSCTFINCDFLNWIIPLNTSWAGGGRYVGEFSSSFHWKGCNISIAIDTGSAGLFSGEDNLQKNSQHGDWSIENCTFYIHHGITTFNGRNAPNGTYFPLARVFSGYDQSGTLFKNNIVFNGTDGGAAKLGPSSLTSLPKVENNALVGFDDEPIFQDRLAEFNNILNIDPLFVAPDNNDFRLRSNSPLIRGIETSSLLPTDAFYVDFDDGNDSNDGKTLENAFATISAAHDASIHLDTIIIVNKTVSLSANLTFPAGRKYRPLDKCTIDGADTHHILITDSAGLDTHVTGFNFKRLRDTKALIDFSGSDDSSLITFQNCVIEGLLTGTKSSAIGGASDSCRSAREGSLIKGCSFDVGWSSSTITTGGNSCGFVAVDKTDLISCTFRAKDITPLNNTSLFLVGTGGYGAWSHGPPIGPVEVKNCIVHGNDRMNYGNGGGSGGNLGFTSNSRVTTASANYVIHSCCLYAIKGDPMAINNSTNLFFRGTVKGDRNIPTESVEDTVTIDPELVDPENGDFRLRPSSKLIGESR